MFDNLSGFDYRDALKHNKKFRNIIYAVGGVAVVAIGYVAYQNFIFGPANEKSKDSWYTSLNYAISDSVNLAIDEAQRGVKKYDGKIGGEINQFILGRELMEKGEFKKALKELEGVKLDDTFLRIATISLQGDCYSELGDYKKAKDFYMKAANAGTNDFSTPANLFKAATVSEKLGQKKEAFDLYTQIKDTYPDYGNQKAIEKYISRTQI